MIWYLIGYVLIGVVSGYLLGLYKGWLAKRRGYNLEEFASYVLYFATEKEMEYVKKNPSVVIVLAIALFNSVFWPVKLIRFAFLYIPDAIEYYESQQNKEELA